MAAKRSTFSESWHRVAALRPRLRMDVQVRRQRFRGRTWHVLGDDANNQHFRFDEGGYRVAALLDGRRTVGEAWQICNAGLGDAAPTQGEVIRLLGQLYTSNLLRGEVAPDTQQMFERYRQRRQREFRSYLGSFLSLRVPLVDPNRFLHGTVRFAGWLFTPVGLALWLVLLMAAGYHLVGRGSELVTGFNPQLLLGTENLLLLYAAFAVVKVIHEFGHGYACVHFARRDGVAGEVHKLGVMFLVFVPTPFIDASSSWMIRSRHHRAIVGAAGMYFELAVAAAAAIVWAHTGADHALLHALCYNVMVVASVSTLLFNLNPLLRFDGYYIMSDLLEIANLAQRAQQQCWHLLRRYVFGVNELESSTHTLREAAWLTVYWFSSAFYRVLVSFSIIMYVLDSFFFVGVLMAAGAIWAWVVMPLTRFVRYLAASPELERVRRRAVGVTSGAVAGLVVLIGLVPVPDRYRAEGVVEPIQLAKIHTAVEGRVTAVLPSGRWVAPGSAPLMESVNPRLESEWVETRAAIRGLTVQREMQRGEDPAQVQAWSEQIAALQKRLQRIELERRNLVIQPPFAGYWFSRVADVLPDSHVKRGTELGLVADVSALVIRVSAGQDFGPRVLSDLGVGDQAEVEVRVRRRPDIQVRGTVSQVLPSGQHELPSEALAAPAGGAHPIDPTDQSGKRTAEPFFEIRIQPEEASGAGAERLLMVTGQRVVVRFSLPPRPIAAQCWRWLEQLLQRRKALREPL